MTRWIAASACALTLALAVPLGNMAEADGIVRRPVVFTKKKCIAPQMRWLWRTSGAPYTWVCAAAERCCYDRVLRKGTCIAANARCF